MVAAPPHVNLSITFNLPSGCTLRNSYVHGGALPRDATVALTINSASLLEEPLMIPSWSYNDTCLMPSSVTLCVYVRWGGSLWDGMGRPVRGGGRLRLRLRLIEGGFGGWLGMLSICVSIWRGSVMLQTKLNSIHLCFGDGAAASSSSVAVIIMRE